MIFLYPQVAEIVRVDVSFICCIIFIFSIIAYSRKGAKHKPEVSILAYVLTCFMAHMVIKITTSFYSPTMFETGVIVILTLLALLNRGNMARVFSKSHDDELFR